MSSTRDTLAELEGAAGDIARWRYLGRNPAIDAGRNPEPRSEELLPFTRAEVDALDAELWARVRAARSVRRRERVAHERVDSD